MKVRVLQQAIEKAFTWGYYEGNPRPAFGDEPRRRVYDEKLEKMAREFAQGQVRLMMPTDSELDI